MKNEQKRSNTLRLLMPQWQGGNNELYSLGARLLAWLAPESDAPLVEVPVEPFDGTPPKKENGVVAQTVLLKQLSAARKIIEVYSPDKIVIFGGDCLISQAPFEYLNEKHGGELGVLWIDAHPDVSRPDNFHHEHAMVLGNLLGEGDPAFAAEVRIPLKPANIMYAGLGAVLDHESKVLNRLKIRQGSSEELAKHSKPILHWIKENKIKHLAIHLDLDVLDPAIFRSLYFSDPIAGADAFKGVTQGTMNFEQLIRLITDASREAELIGLGIAEHLPWDAKNLKNILEQFPILR